MKQKICLAVGVAMTLLCQGAHAQVSARTAIADEPIILPKIEAGRVTARLNGPTAPVDSSVVKTESISAQRIGGVTTIRVSPEIGLPYVLSNASQGNVLRGREHDSFRVPLWQIGKF